MARVTRRGGVILAEFYNPNSLRALVKLLGPAGTVAQGTDERQVYTRFDSPAAVRRLVPAGCRWLDARGVRIITPSALLLRVRRLRQLFRAAEWALCDSPLKVFGGFYVAAMERV